MAKKKLLDSIRKRVFIAMNIIFMTILIGYGTYNVIILNTLVGILEILTALILLVSLLLFIKKISYALPLGALMLSLYLISIFLFITGGAHNTGIFWLFIIPVVFFFFLGLKWGFSLFVLQSFSIIFIYFLSKIDILSIPYRDTTVIFFLIVSSSEAIVLFIHELILKKYYTQIKVMKGLLPICANCKKIRDNNGLWNHIENYIHEHSEANLTHSICPECAKELYPDIDYTNIK